MIDLYKFKDIKNNADIDKESQLRCTGKSDIVVYSYYSWLFNWFLYL